MTVPSGVASLAFKRGSGFHQREGGVRWVAKVRKTTIYNEIAKEEVQTPSTPLPDYATDGTVPKSVLDNVGRQVDRIAAVIGGKTETRIYD